jgi:hypothetical protein
MAHAHGHHQPGESLVHPISIAGASASMDMQSSEARAFQSVTLASGAYNAGNQDPASTLVRITASAINPKFTF